LQNTAQSLTNTRPRNKAEALRAVCGIINKWRLSNGWQIMDAKDAELTGLAWVEILETAGIKPEQYNGLYNQALQMRAQKIALGNDSPSFNAELLVAAHRANQRQPREASERKHDCKICFGSGFVHHHDANGALLGVGGRCRHD